VITGLQKVYAFVGDAINQPVFLRYPPGPTACQRIAERFRFAQTLEGVAHHCLHKFQHSDRGRPVALDPILKVVPKLRLKNGDSFKNL